MEWFDQIFILACLMILLGVLYLGYRIVVPMVRSLSVLGQDSDSLQARVIPTLAFLALLSIMLKLTIF